MAPLDRDSQILWESYQVIQIDEITDSKRNREALRNAYGLQDDAQASDIIAQWNKYESLIDTDPETFGFPRNVRNLNPKDIFAWSRASKQTGGDHEEARGNLLAMIENLKKVFANREKQKQQLDDYETLYSSDKLVVYKPNSEGASCKLGAGTKWCTAATKTKNMFDDYTKNKGVVLYYFHTAHEGKYALAVYPTGETEVFDEEDNQIRLDDLMMTVRDHGADLNSIVKLPDKYESLKNMCDRYTKSIGQSFPDDGELVNNDQLAMDIIQKSQKLSQQDSAGFQQFRAETKQPDQALLSHRGQYHYSSPSGKFNDKNGEDMIDFHAVTFFFSSVLNPAGSMPDTNRMFQRQVESTAINHMESVIKDYANWQPTGFEQPFDGSDMKTQFVSDIENGLGYMSDAHNDNGLLTYSKRHMNGSWDNLHDITLDIVAEQPDKVIGNKVTVGLVMFVMREKQGRWPELEQLVKDEIKLRSQQGWTEHNHSILRLSEFYNRSVTGLLGRPDIIKILPTYSDTIGNK